MSRPFDQQAVYETFERLEQLTYFCTITCVFFQFIMIDFWSFCGLLQNKAKKTFKHFKEIIFK